MASLSSLTSVQRARFYARGDAVVAAVSDDDLDTALELASLRLPAANWGEMYTDAACLLALHILVATPAGSGSAAGGPVTSETVGQWSQARASVTDLTSRNVWLMSSTYGQQLVQLASTRSARMPFIARGGASDA